MKKVLSMVLAVVMLISMLPAVSMAAGSESQITSPSNNEWLDTWNNNVVIKWTKPASGHSNKITVVNTRTNEYLLQNKVVSGTSYSIPKRTLDYEENYKVWVGTFDGNEALGHGSVITFNTIPLKDIDGIASKITYPANKEWVNAGKDIVIKWSKSDSALDNKLTVVNTRTNEYLFQNKAVNGTNYTISKGTLDFEENYKVWVGTFYEGESVSGGHAITFSTMSAAESVSQASITVPTNNATIDATEDLTVRCSDISSDLKYRITVLNQTTNAYVVQNKVFTGAKYTLNANTLEPDSTYKIWVGTYLTSDLDSAVGHGKSVIVKTKKGEVEQQPEPTATLEIKEFAWRIENTDAVGSYEVAGDGFDHVVIEVNDAYGRAIFDQRYDAAFKGVRINMEDCADGRYTCILRVYDEDGAEVCEETATFAYEKPEEKEAPKTSLEVQAFGWNMSNTTAIGHYEVTGDGFDCAVVEILDADDSVIYSKEFAASTKTMKFDMAEYPGGKYTSKMVVYDENSEVVCSALTYFTYNKKEEEKKEPLKITDCYFMSEADKFVLVYSVSGDEFSYVEIRIEDEDGNAVANKNVYQAKGELSVPLSELAGGAYTGTIDVYSTAGEKADSDSASFEYKKTVESRFSVKSIVAPSGTLKYGEAFNASGRVISACEITNAKILIYKQGTTEPVDSVHKKNFGKTEFDIGAFASQIDFGILDAGDYTYVVEVTDVNGEQYTAVESDFAVEAEQEQTQNSLFKDVSNTHVNYEAIAALVEKGVISGYEDGTFRPNQSITRAEFVKMLCTTFDLGTSSGVSFDDTRNHWGKAYIERAKNLGIVNGKGDNKFAPDDNVTYEEAAKMLVCIKGWETEALYNGGWPDGYIAVAKAGGMLDNTKILSSQHYATNAIRADVAQMMYNAWKVGGGSEELSVDDSEVYIKQATSTSCTLASTVMIFRRRAILDGNENWWMIRENTMREQGNWIDGEGMISTPSYRNDDCNLDIHGTRLRINYYSSGILKEDANAEDTINVVKQYLDWHPEGVVLYIFKSGGWQHAVALTRYDENGFYCADPNSKYAGKEINLMESSLVDSDHANTKNLERLFSNHVAIWYIANH